MYRQKNLLRLGQGALAGAPPVRVTCNRVADNVVLPLLVADGEQHFVNGVLQIEQADKRLQLELRIGAQRSQVRFRQLRFRCLVEGLDFSPLQSRHVESDVFDASYKLRMRTQPWFQARS